MLYKTSLLLTAMYGIIAYNANLPKQHVLDFNQSNICVGNELDWKGIEQYCKPFNNSIELIPYFDYLQDVFQLECVVRTGTWEKETTKFLGYLFNQVHTMETELDLYEAARVAFLSNVILYYGYSHFILRQILPTLQGKKSLFYLGVDRFGERRLLEELECISQTHYENCILVIDYCKVPGRTDILYDINNGHECSYEYVQKALAKIFFSYSYQFVIPKSASAGAKLIVMPRKWIEQCR